MKLFFVSSGLMITMGATGATGCAFGSVATLDDLKVDSPPLDPATDPAPSSVEAGTLGPDEAGRDHVAPSAPPPGDAGKSGAPEGGALAVDASGAPDGGAPPAACAFAYAGSLVSFDLAAVTGVPASVGPAAIAAGLTVTPLERVGVTPVSASGALNASTWPTGGLQPGKYYTFTVTAPAGCTMTLTTVVVDLKASTNGPKNAAVGSSVDKFAALAAATVTTAGGAATVPVPGVVAIQGAVELRVFGFAAAASGGTLRVQDVLTLAGSLN
jgi:hypothetical protein